MPLSGKFAGAMPAAPRSRERAAAARDGGRRPSRSRVALCAVTVQLTGGPWVGPARASSPCVGQLPGSVKLAAGSLRRTSPRAQAVTRSARRAGPDRTRGLRRDQWELADDDPIDVTQHEAPIHELRRGAARRTQHLHCLAAELLGIRRSCLGHGGRPSSSLRGPIPAVSGQPGPLQIGGTTSRTILVRWCWRLLGAAQRS